MYFDTHAHYDDPRFDADREELLAALPEKGVGRIVNCGSDAASSRLSIHHGEEKYENIGDEQAACQSHLSPHQYAKKNLFLFFSTNSYILSSSPHERIPGASFFSLCFLGL